MAQPIRKMEVAQVAYLVAVALIFVSTSLSLAGLDLKSGEERTSSSTAAPREMTKSC